MTSLGA